MIKKKISLRLHIFLSFFIVFLISFAVIIFSFNIVVENYIQSDSNDKLKTTEDKARILAAQKIDDRPTLPGQTDSTDMIKKRIIESLSGSSDVSVALINSDYSIDFSASSGSSKDMLTAKSVAAQLETDQIKLGTNAGVVKIDQSSYYVSTFLFDEPYYSNSLSAPQYLILYLDSSPYHEFAESLYGILMFILLIALALSLLVSLAVSNSIIQSIRKLTDFASKIGAGIFNRQEFNFFDKELDILAADMNIMADKLDQTDKEQKTFFQNASHELRTPLMSIQGYAEGIRYKVFEDQDSAADVIISESQRLTGMVENLLNISRMDTAAAGRQAIPKHILDLRELLESVVEKMRGSALLSQKNISLHFTEKSVNILGNDNDLFRAFENVVSNGLRYAKSCVDLTVIDKAPDQVVVMITDDGKGIAAELLPIIFDRFSHGEDGKHGIGLALVKAIISEHKGTVTAANRRDGTVGAVFTVTLNTSSIDSSI